MSLVAKRAMDVVVAGAVLVLLGPVMLGIALAIRITMGSPVFYRQLRPGLHGQPFELVKFRTMREARDERGHELPPHLRITPLGQLLRRTSLDELPEAWNILKGEMSLVGPRPLLMEYLPLYTPEQARRHDVKPGLTGLAQVSGRQLLDWDDRFRLDLRYVDGWSLLLDLRILAATARIAVTGEGVPDIDHVYTKFRGERDEEGGALAARGAPPPSAGTGAP